MRLQKNHLNHDFMITNYEKLIIRFHVNFNIKNFYISTAFMITYLFPIRPYIITKIAIKRCNLQAKLHLRNA